MRRPQPRDPVSRARTPGATRRARLAAGEATLVEPVGRRRRQCAWRCREPTARSPSSTSPATAALSLGGGVHPPAIRLERAACDLCGFDRDRRAGRRGRGSTTAAGRCAIRSGGARGARRRAGRLSLPRRRGRRACIRSRSARCTPASSSPAISASHASGEAVVRLEERLGYVHKGIERLMGGAERRARRACSPARVSGDSTVAYGVAFARAVEAALGIEAPPRAHVAARRSWPSSRGSPIISATSARSATMRPSR